MLAIFHEFDHFCCLQNRDAHNPTADMKNESKVSLLEDELTLTLKPQSNGPLYSNTVIGTLAVDGRAAARPGPSSLYQM